MNGVLNSLEICDVVRVRVTGDHRIAVRFKDGLVAEVPMGEWLSKQHGPMVEPLKSPAFFADVDIENGVLVWPNGYDLNPKTLRHWAENGI